METGGLLSFVHVQSSLWSVGLWPSTLESTEGVYPGAAAFGHILSRPKTLKKSGLWEACSLLGRQPTLFELFFLIAS